MLHTFAVNKSTYMKKYIISLVLLLSLGSAYSNAQSFLEKLGKSINRTQSQKQPQKIKSIVPTVTEVQPADSPVTGMMNGYEWVDLGLPSGTLWATCNVGAGEASQPGTLYAWGETAEKNSYTPDNSRHHTQDIDDFSGDKTNDVATAKWGEGWRMPTKDEYDELLYYCNWKYVQKDGRWGSELTNPANNRSIFLPATGYMDGTQLQNASGNGIYWTSTPRKDQWKNGAYMYQFGGALGEVSISERSYGHAVRPVSDNKSMIDTPSQGVTNGHEWVDLGLPSGKKWATCNLGAATSENHGDFYEWAEITTITDKDAPKNESGSKTSSDIGGNTTYDAATALWGEGWEMPSKEDFQELMEHCTWEWTALGRIKGCKVTSKTNGNYIFLPASGKIYSNPVDNFPYDLNESGWYWASSSSDDEYHINSDAFLITRTYVGTSVQRRRDGFTIRPVTE